MQTPDNTDTNTQAVNPTNSGAVWERSLIEQLLAQGIAEQRARRRWGIFFKSAFLLLALLVVWLIVAGSNFKKGADTSASGVHTALVELSGAMEAGGPAGADRINAALLAAFKDPGTQAVVMRINSPGGSPVQASLINDEIARLRKLYPKIPLYAVVEEICASGGYYVAVGADKIYVNPASIIGSIGVIMDGFGFTGTMDKLGVERRQLTAGVNKGFLDPFSPLNPAHKTHVEDLLAQVHQQFIDAVKKGRGKRLKPTPDMFSGLFWTGQKSIELGLSDEVGSLDSVARDVVKAEEIVDFTQRENFAEQIAKRLGTQVGEGAVKAVVRGAQREVRGGGVLR